MLPAARRRVIRASARSWVLAGVGLLCAGVAESQASATATQTLNVRIGANAKLRAVQSTVNLVSSGSVFSKFTGSVTLQYKVRTTAGTGNSSISASASSDFTPSQGPRVSAGDLTYSCGGATLGNACSGASTVVVGSQSAVLTVGAGACTGQGCTGADPNTVTITYDLANSPTYKTGNYATGLTYTISSL